MANPGYVRSTDGNDADNGSTWALANASLAGGFTDASAGNRIYVSDNHAESQTSAITLASPGTSGAPLEVVCGDDSAEPPTAVATTATITTTNSSNINFTGSTYFYGIKFSCSSGSFGDININVTNTINQVSVFDNCELELANTNSLSDIFIGGAAAGAQAPRVEFINTNLRFGGSGQGVDLQGCIWFWLGGTVLGTMPTTLINPITTPHIASRVIFRGVDLSPLGSNNIVSLSSVDGRLELELHDCKLGASAVIVTGSWTHPGGYVLVVNCDSADTNYRYYKSTYRGEIFHETTIVRTGGASDGTIAFSRKMVSSANSEFTAPLIFGDLEGSLLAWNETIGNSVTATVEVVTDNVTLTDAEAWIEVIYSGTSGNPLGSFVRDRITNILTTPANQTTSSETWTTTGLTTPVKQKLSVSFTPQEKGWIQVRVMLAKASTTMYFCPKVDIT